MYFDAIKQRGLFVRTGDRVRIVVGPLANWLATVVRLSSRHRCVLSIDGLSEGVFIILPADDLERM